jgi:hypothetical protein
MPSMIRGDWVELAFSAGSLQLDEPMTFKTRRLGEIALPSGRIGASDPLVLAQPEPFSTAVPPGRYPVELAVAVLENEDERTAYARLLFSTEPAIRWAMAVTPGQDPSTLSEEEIFGYDVDTGTGCFLSPEVGQVLANRMAEESGYYETFIEEMQKNYQDTWSWASLRPDPASELSVIVFSTGYGDGVYASYFGLSADGRPVALVTDFQVIAEPILREAPKATAVPPAADPGKPSLWGRWAGFFKR